MERSDLLARWGASMKQVILNKTQLIEIASGKNLTDYFNRWIYGEGFPKYTITWETNFDNLLSLK